MTARLEFTKPTKREALARSGMKCEAIGVMYGLPKAHQCNADLAYGVEYDHIVRASDGGDNSLSNCAAVCIKCHDYKSRKVDTPGAAKTKRMSDKNVGIRKKPKKPIPSRNDLKAEPKQPKIDKSVLPTIERRSLFRPAG